jgi:uncharacterized protein with HEPN domain
MYGRRVESAYLRDMIASCERIAVFSVGVADDDLLSTELPQRGAIHHELIFMGEAAKHVSPETATASPDIPWADLARLRDKLVHYYHGLDDALLLDIVRSSVPGVLPKLRSLLAEMASGH